MFWFFTKVERCPWTGEHRMVLHVGGDKDGRLLGRKTPVDLSHFVRVRPGEPTHDSYRMDGTGQARI